MSAIFQEIKEAEMKAEEEVSVVKSSIKKAKDEAIQKARDLLLDSKKDTDTSFSSKIAVLEKDLAKKEEEGLSLIRSEVESFSKKTDEYVKKGVEFLFPYLV